MRAEKHSLETGERSGLSRRQAAALGMNILALAGIYFLTGRLGLQLAFGNQNATPVWPPTGIALAALLLLGRNLWPGIALGALLVNLYNTGSLPLSLGIAVGNTLEVVAGEWLVRRFAGGRQVFERARTTFAFIVLALLSACIAATIGVTSLGLAGEIAWQSAPVVWLTWWTGDAVSAVMITPLIVLWAATPLPKLRPRLFEAVLLSAALALVSLVVFGGVLPMRAPRDEISFALTPPLLWAAFRFGQRGAVTAAAGLSSVAIWGTLHRHGPFAADNANESLLLLQAFLATITVTNLMLGAVVSERRRSEESLKRSDQEARNRHTELQGVMEAVPAVIWIAHDRDCRIITGNPASYDLLRMPHGQNASLSDPEQVERSSFEVFQNGRKLAPAELPVQRAAAGETIRNFEEEVRFADGSSRFLFGNASPLRDEAGRARGAVAAFVDITERKQAERRLAANLAVAERLVSSPAAGDALSGVLRTICETLEWNVGAIWTPTFDGQALRCQEVWHVPSLEVPQFVAVSRRTSFPPGVGLPGRVWQSLAPAWIPDVTQDANFPRAPYATAEGLHGAFGFPVICSGRCVAVVEFFSREIREPDRKMLAMFAGLGAQIGQYIERQRAEEALRASQVQLQLVTDCMSAPVTRCTRDLRYAWVSKPYADWCGRPPETIIGRPIVEILGETAFARLKPYFERVLSGETVRYEELIDFSGPGPRWVSAVYSPTFDVAGRPDGWVAVVLDIDQRKRTEDALREADRRKDEFLAILAHELRNPLAPIRHALALLERQSAADSEAEGPLGVIDRQVGQLERLLDDLLDVGRITSGKLKLARERISLADVLAIAAETSRAALDGRQHALRVDVPTEPIFVRGDLVRLGQVFANLLQNAAKYTERGGDIRVSAERRGSEAVVCVRDNGIGIPRDELEHIFEMFAQVDNSLERTNGGLGIGLTLVRKLVEMHGGRIQARSAGPGQGSEFTVHLPLEIGQAAEAQPGREKQDVGRRPGLRILVADDNLDGARTLGQLLELRGHQTQLAHDGQDALEKMSSFEPDAALVDIGMPRLNGYEVARRVRESSGGRAIFLVALTGWGQDSDKLRAQEAGFNAHVTKPARIDAIEELLVNVKPREARGQRPV